MIEGLRKTVLLRETVVADETGTSCDPITRAAMVAILKNPLCGRAGADLGPLIEASRDLAESLFPEVAKALPNAATSYGKAAIVGLAGEVEHGHAMLHPKLGAPIRATLGGGAALIPSNAKVAAAGAPMDLPLGHKDDAWSRDHFDTWTICVADAPRMDEIALIMAAADGGRANPRC